MFIVLILILLQEPGAAEDLPTKGIAAIVGDHRISENRVDQHLKKTVAEKLRGPMLMKAKKVAIDHLIDRHRVLVAIESKGFAAGQSEIEFEISKLRDRLSEVSQEIDGFLRTKGTTIGELRYEFRWEIAWRKYLDKTLSKPRLEKYFEKHRRTFDGTRMQVAHILMQQNDQPDPPTALRQIRQRILSGEVNWKNAAENYSASLASKSSNGEIGWITYDGPMHADFCSAAMELKIGEISEPVATPFGWHLIKCLDIEDGQRQFEDVEPAVKDHAMRYLFDTLCRKSAADIPVEYHAQWAR